MIAKILKFSTDWCAPCIALDKRLKGFDAVPIEELDVSDTELTKKHAVRHLPLLIFLNEEGKVCARLSGIVTLESINEILNEYGIYKHE